MMSSSSRVTATDVNMPVAIVSDGPDRQLKTTLGDVAPAGDFQEHEPGIGGSKLWPSSRTKCLSV